MSYIVVVKTPTTAQYYNYKLANLPEVLEVVAARLHDEVNPSVEAFRKIADTAREYYIMRAKRLLGIIDSTLEKP